MDNNPEKADLPGNGSDDSLGNSLATGSKDALRREKPLQESIIAVAAGLVIAVIILLGARGSQEPELNSLAKLTQPEGGNVVESMSPLSTDKNTCGVEESGTLACSIQEQANSCAVGNGELCHADIEIAKIAWKYFENNYNPETGLVNAVNNFPSTTMWDTGSALAATIAARDFGFIGKKDFDNRIMSMMKTLATMDLFNGEAPNKVYNTKTAKMVDYGNKVIEGGIGVSGLDLARMMSWMNTLSCLYPVYQNAATQNLSRWDYTRLVKDGNLYGMARDKKDKSKIKVLQEGRLGYEQYAGKILRNFGFDQSVAASYENQHRGNIDIMGVNIAYDTRDPRKYHANNYVVTESYTMDVMELGMDDENRDLMRNIYEVQKRRWQETGIVTAISEDNINQKPYFLYNTIFNAGLPWQTTNSSDVQYDHLKTLSTKAAFTMAMVYPEDDYSQVLLAAIENAYDPELGWYSGVYESGAGYNTVTTANTNGVILESLLYKKYGALMPHCEGCAQTIQIDSEVLRKPQKYTGCELCAIEGG